ncbi:unnamed protein product [Oncorhynchus mykiss]|uniref:Uncharacterized protein n=1 Tax=Oncorhynchus mykiss TaxID=8022 RepID=A0A060XL69_ONCMY|nr:unnamed protein product [Oncorhynchus mykiss]
MAEKIQDLEKAAIGEKPWKLTGDVSAQTRPENSLLEVDVAFDSASRMAPAVTEETTLQLEDIIKQRIKDQVWDHVVRKEKPTEEKSKLSLAEVYEQEYLKQNQQKTEDEENPAHVEIQKLVDSLFLKLDALSNFHFTHKLPVPEVKVVSNLPSIAMEEVVRVMPLYWLQRKSRRRTRLVTCWRKSRIHGSQATRQVAVNLANVPNSWPSCLGEDSKQKDSGSTSDW